MTFIEIFILGVVGGVSPGPITALMLGETFKHGLKAGVKVPFTLIFSNVLIGATALGVFFMGKDMSLFLEAFTYLGAIILLWMGVQEFHSSGKLNLKSSTQVFKKTLMIELGNPHPYIFWFGVLAPAIIIRTKTAGFTWIFISWLAFVFGLVGTKLLIVLFASLIRTHLKEPHILWVSRILALVLIAFGLKLLFF